MDDFISRQAAITQLSHNKNKGDDEWELAVENDIQTIWKLPPAQPKTNYSESPNTSDCISREQAIDAVMECYDNDELFEVYEWKLNELPTIQPEIIRCRNCKFASGDSRICMKFGHSPIGELDFCAWAERRTDE